MYVMMCLSAFIKTPPAPGRNCHMLRLWLSYREREARKSRRMFCWFTMVYYVYYVYYNTVGMLVNIPVNDR